MKHLVLACLLAACSGSSKPAPASATEGSAADLTQGSNWAAGSDAPAGVETGATGPGSGASAKQPAGGGKANGEPCDVGRTDECQAGLKCAAPEGAPTRNGTCQ